MPMRDRRMPEPLLAPRTAARGKKPSPELGDLPEWNLADLYPSMDSPELKRDMERAGSDAVAFEQRWKGTLAAEAARGSEGRLGEAVKAYEEIQELMGRIVSYASLIYAGDSLRVPFDRPRHRAAVLDDPRYYPLREHLLAFLAAQEGH